MNKKELKMYHQKMADEELQMFLAFRRKGFSVPAKKGKGSYNRKKLKNMKEW